jgi:hypothetical protein
VFDKFDISGCFERDVFSQLEVFLDFQDDKLVRGGVSNVLA